MLLAHHLSVQPSLNAFLRLRKVRIHRSCGPWASIFCPTGTSDYTFLWMRVAVHLTAPFPLWVILARASCWAELQLFNIVWNLAIRTPLRGPSTASPHGNHHTNSQQARPFPMIMNENVQHVSIHLSDTLWWLIKPQKCVVCHRLNSCCRNLSISRCIGSPRSRAVRHLGCHALSDMSSWARR